MSNDQSGFLELRECTHYDVTIIDKIIPTDCLNDEIFVLFEPYVRFHILRSVRVTKWPLIGE